MEALTHMNRSKDRCALLVLTLSALLLASMFGLPAVSQAAYPGANGRVAWEGYPSGTDKEIMSANPDGSNLVALTTNTVDDKDPAWSPDGKKIAFARLNGSIWEIWTMNATGGGQTPLVQQPKSATHPTWSRDGTKIAFEYAFSATDDDIYTAATSGLNTSVAGLVITVQNERDPAWAPQGSLIAFSKFNTTNSHYDLVTVPGPPGGAVTTVLSDAAHDYTEPAWSPDQTKLAVQYQSSPTNDDIKTLNANGSGVTNLSATGLNERNPAWSPEAQLIAFDRDGDFELVTQRSDGSLGNVISTPGLDTNPDWQPVTTAQVRPQSTAPLNLPLTIAYNDCGLGTVTHDPPLNLQACAPPDATSPDLTVGEPQVNGQQAKANGYIRLKTLSPSDGQVTVSVTDVRCANYFTGCNVLLGDYTGDLLMGLAFRITDRANAGGVAGTLDEITMGIIHVPCQATGDTTVGSTCQLTTTLNSIRPGVVVPGKRASWVLTEAKLSDTSSHTFLVPGSFYP